MKKVDTIFHFVDVQSTFWEAMNGRLAGPLAVPGSAWIAKNLRTLTELGRDNPRVKVIRTKDYHFEVERRKAELNQEFHAPYHFPAHGMAEESGPSGHEFIPEIRDAFSVDQELIIPHHRERKGSNPNEDTLELVPFDIHSYVDQILNPDIVTTIQKNGPLSYDFGVNPHSKQIVDLIRPKKVIAAGVATDFCVQYAVKTYLNWGYEVSVVSDAIAGVFPKNAEEELEVMNKAGAKFITTADAIAEFKVV